MATEFDPLKAAREELAGMADIMIALKQREIAAEQAMGKAESELNAIRKLRGFAHDWVARKRSEIAKLEAKEAR